MVALVTGGTGLIGQRIAQQLIAGGHRVRALVRDLERGKRMLPPGTEFVLGDVTAPETLAPAVKGAQWVFHAAGLPEQWQRDEAIFDRVNRVGTKNLLEAALRAGVQRVIYTSTMDVFAAPRGGTLVETHVDPQPKPTAYERSKQKAEEEADRIRGQGLDVVFVNPGAVYGPSPIEGALNGFFVRLLRGKVPMLPPGGMPVAFHDGVAAAHLAAAERGRTGERYLVADEHVTMAALAREIVAAEGKGRRLPPVAPERLMQAVVAVSTPLARTLRFTPLVAPGELSFMVWNVAVDASKAKAELGFTPTPLEEGVRRTVEAFAGKR